MKKLALLPVLFLFFLSSCKKENDPEPDLAAIVEGTYVMSSVTNNGQTITLPQNGVKGTITFSKVGAKSTKVRLLATRDDVIITDQTTTLYLRSSSAGVDFFNDADLKTSIGSGTKNVVSLSNGTDGFQGTR